MNKPLFTLAAAFVAAALAVGSAQTPAPQSAHPTFEVASVKRNKEGGSFSVFFQPGGRFRAVNVTLKMLIGTAYGTPQPLPDYQISGGAKWLETDRFDIVAKAAGDPPPGPNGPPPLMFEMIRSLLEERFHLKVHNEMKEAPVFALMLARPAGQLGPQFRQTDVDCSPAAIMRAARERGGGPPAPPAPGERPKCGARMLPGNLSAGAQTIAQIVNGLARLGDVNRQVIDRTGLPGAYDVDLVWTPASLPQGDRPPGAPPLPPIDPNGPSLFTAIQEQWGLKLEPTKAPVNMLIIDAAEQPTED